MTHQTDTTTPFVLVAVMTVAAALALLGGWVDLLVLSVTIAVWFLGTAIDLLPVMQRRGPWRVSPLACWALAAAVCVLGWRYAQPAAYVAALVGGMAFMEVTTPRKEAR